MSKGKIIKFTPDRQADCQLLGNLIVCLHYLSSEARRDSLPEAAAEVDAAAQRILAIGLHRMNADPQSAARMQDMIDDGRAFVDRYCEISDQGFRSSLTAALRLCRPEKH